MFVATRTVECLRLAPVSFGVVTTATQSFMVWLMRAALLADQALYFGLTDSAQLESIDASKHHPRRKP